MMWEQYYIEFDKVNKILKEVQSKLDRASNEVDYKNGEPDSGSDAIALSLISEMICSLSKAQVALNGATHAKLLSINHKGR